MAEFVGGRDRLPCEWLRGRDAKEIHAKYNFCASLLSIGLMSGDTMDLV